MPELDPFEQFKGQMEPLDSPHARGTRQPRILRPTQRPVPQEVREKLKAVSADQDAETIRRVEQREDRGLAGERRVNRQISKNIGFGALYGASSKNISRRFLQPEPSAVERLGVLADPDLALRVLAHDDPLAWLEKVQEQWREQYIARVCDRVREINELVERSTTRPGSTSVP